MPFYYRYFYGGAVSSWMRSCATSTRSACLELRSSSACWQPDTRPSSETFNYLTSIVRRGDETFLVWSAETVAVQEQRAQAYGAE